MEGQICKSAVALIQGLHRMLLQKYTWVKYWTCKNYSLCLQNYIRLKIYKLFKQGYFSTFRKERQLKNKTPNNSVKGSGISYLVMLSL